MIIASKTRSLLRVLIALKWVSTSTIIKTQSQLPRFQDHLSALFDDKVDTKQSDYEPALVSALKSCSSLLAVSQGQQLHCFIFKSGIDSNIFVQNSLINLYAKCGLIFDARKMFDSCSHLDSVSCNIMIAGYVKFGYLNNAWELFDKMPHRGCVSYTTMIMGLAHNNCWREAIEVFRNMKYAGVALNEVTLASVISAYSHVGGSGTCQMLHSLSIKLGLESLNLVSTNLVHLYCIHSSLDSARIIFDEMTDPNTVSWNVMLNGYSKAGLVVLARELFERIPNKDVVSWGTVTDGYVQVEMIDEALSLFRLMLQTGLAPNEVMMVDLISACGKSMVIIEGQQLHCTIQKLGFDCYDFMQATIIYFYSACQMIYLACSQFEVSSKSHLSCWNALISGFIRCGRIDSAQHIFNEMPQRDVFAWSSMISGYSQNGQADLALELFKKMIDSGIKPNEVTMVSVLSSIATLGNLKEGKHAHEYILTNSIVINDNLSAALMDMYAKCGSINMALEVFYQIQDRVSSVSPYNAIICGLAMHGHAKLSLKIFSDLQKLVFIEPNSITFIGVLTACCHAGLVEEGKGYFMSMKSLYKVEPSIKHYGCMVDLLGRAGRLEEAVKLIWRMPMKADVVIWGTLLAACRIHGNVEIGEMAAECLAGVEPFHGAARVLLSNLYADAERWDDAFLVRRQMQSERMMKSPGSSGVV